MSQKARKSASHVTIWKGVRQYSLHKFRNKFFFLRFFMFVFIYTRFLSNNHSIPSGKMERNSFVYTHSHNHFRFREEEEKKTRSSPMWIQKGNIIQCATWILPRTYLVSKRKLLKGCLKCKPVQEFVLLLWFLFRCGGDC